MPRKTIKAAARPPAARRERAAPQPLRDDAPRPWPVLSSAWPGATLSLLLLCATWASFWPALDCGFVNYDDGSYVYNNARLKSGLSPSNLLWALTTFDCANWHPLTWFSLQLDYELFRLHPAGYHLTGVALHAVNVLLLFWTLKLMTGAAGRSAAVAGFFALHPLHVESVAWISERKDVLSTLFFLLAILAYWFYCQRPDWRRYLAVAAAYALGLMAKPMLVTFPCVLLLLDAWPLRRWGRLPAASLVLEKLPLFALAAVSSAITIAAQQHGKAVMSVAKLPLATRLGNSALGYTGYLQKTFWPVKLAAYYPHLGGDEPPWQAAAILLGLLSLAIWRWSSSRPYLAVGWCWWLGTLVPVVGLVQVGSQSMADRYMYIPLIGLAIACCWGVYDLVRERPWAASVLGCTCVVLLLCCGALTQGQTEHWRDSVGLWRHALSVTGPNAVACNNLGSALLERGELDAAKPWLEKCLQIDPDFAEAHRSLATALISMGRPEDAIEHLNAALRIQPDAAVPHFNLGVLIERRGDSAAAVRHFRESIRLEPSFWQAHLELAKALDQCGQKAEARRHFSLAAKINPQLLSSPPNRSAE